MTVNVFEGARRVVRITAVLWVVVVCAMAMIDFKPSIITIRYLVEGIPIPMKEYNWDPLDVLLEAKKRITQVSDDPLDKYLATTQKISEYQRVARAPRFGAGGHGAHGR